MPTCLRNQKSASRRTACWTAFAGIFFALVVSGCVKPPPPYVAAYAQPARQAHCFDGIPHIRGSKPWVLGGACCCTPSDALMEKLHADGVCLNLDTAGLVSLYHEKGIQLATDHANCNNLCSAGPHVVKGGKCMVPPTPGTRNYEEIVTGVIYAPPKDSKKK